jgi:predicted nucleotide-binding protein (sugar kinase/HSP70/actin superfamily)
MRHLTQRTDPHTVTLCFMATGGGPCRLGQYCRALEQVIHRNRIPNAAVWTLSDENGYAGLGSRALLRGWQAVVASDVFGDVRSMLAVTARHPAQALADFDACWREVLACFEGRLSVRFTTLLSNLSARLSRIPLEKDPRDVPVVSLVGEIFVRREEFSRKNVVDYLQDHGFMVKVAPVGEYLCYGNYVINRGLGDREFTLKDHVKMKITVGAQEWWERKIKSILASSGLYRFEMIDVAETIHGVKHLLNENFRGECILTVGLAMREILHDSCGIVSIGPFGCMPSRVAEAMLKKELTVEGKARAPGGNGRAGRLSGIEDLPFLAIETDGSPFPQLTEANLEAFVLRARRVHEALMGAKRPASRPRETMLASADKA